MACLKTTQRGVVVHEPSGRGEPAEPHAEYLLKQRREHEQRNRQAERGQYHREIVQYRVLFHRSQRAKRYAEYQSHDHGERSKYDRIRQRYADEGIHIIVLVLVARAEIASDDVEHIASILHEKRLVHMVLGLDVPLYSFRQGPLPIERTAGCDADDEEAQCDNDEESRYHSYQSFDDVFCH